MELFGLPLTDRKLLKGTLGVRAFGLTKVPLLAFVAPTLVEVSREEVAFRIPLNWRTKNHLGSMYFGVLAAGADLAAGYHAMEAIYRSKRKVALIFKAVQAEFLKRAEGDVVFRSTGGAAIEALVAETVASGERVELPVPVIATVPSLSGSEPVAKFTLTLSLKKKD